MSRRMRRGAGWLVALGILAVLVLVGYGSLRGRPQDLPWTPLDLGQPIGLFTGRKLTTLTSDFAQCRRLLNRAGVQYTALAPVGSGGTCSYRNGVRLDPGGAREIGFAPPGVGMACPVAAALALWEWDVVQPAAERRLGSRVKRFEHFGSYNCRRMYGRDTGSWSEHATANAIDIAGFELIDGRRITIVGDWNAGGPKSAFLREVRDGACRVFATVLSPDYNTAHHDHLHLDQAERGTMGWRACR